MSRHWRIRLRSIRASSRTLRLRIPCRLAFLALATLPSSVFGPHDRPHGFQPSRISIPGNSASQVSGQTSLTGDGLARTRGRARICAASGGSLFDRVLRLVQPTPPSPGARVANTGRGLLRQSRVGPGRGGVTRWRWDAVNLWTVGCADARRTAQARSPMDKPGKTLCVSHLAHRSAAVHKTS